MNPTSSGPFLAPTNRKATAREFFAVLFRRKWVILGLFFATTATVAALALTTKTVYQSTGRVLVVRGERESALGPGRQMVSDWEQELGSEMQIIRSYPVMHRVREILRDGERKGGKPIPFDAGLIDVEVMGKSDVLGIGYSSGNPEVAQAACDAVITAYVDYRRTSLGIEQPEAFFDRELADIDVQIRQKLEERRRTALESGTLDPGDANRGFEMQEGIVAQRRTEAEADLAEAQSSLELAKELQANSTIDVPSITSGVPFSNEQALITLKQHVLEQQTKLATLRERYRDDAPEVVSAQQTLETLQDLLHKEVDTRLTLLQSRIETLKAKVAAFARQEDALQQERAKMPQSYEAVTRIDASLSELRNRQHELTLSRDQTRITAHTSQDRRIVLLSGAGFPVITNRLDIVRLALAPAFSLVVGIAIAFFIDGLDLTVRTSQQAEEAMELPVLASITERRTRRG